MSVKHPGRVDIRCAKCRQRVAWADPTSGGAHAIGGRRHGDRVLHLRDADWPPTPGIDRSILPRTVLAPVTWGHRGRSSPDGPLRWEFFCRCGETPTIDEDPLLVLVVAAPDAEVQI